MTLDNPSIHMDQHPHALLSYDNVVTNVVVMASCDDTETIEGLKSGLFASDVISCCKYGMATVGGTFDGTRFYPRKIHASFVWSEGDNTWVPPVPMPTDAIYRWDEPTLSWVYVRDFE